MLGRHQNTKGKISKLKSYFLFLSKTLLTLSLSKNDGKSSVLFVLLHIMIRVENFEVIIE